MTTRYKSDGGESNDQRLWNRMKREADGDTTKLVQIGLVASNELPMHKEQTTNIVKNWENRGLVEAYENGATARLTREGKEVDDV